MKQPLDLSIIVPTYNEEQNVQRLIEEIHGNLKGINYKIIFVDDSTDKTPNIIRELIRSYKNICLIHRQGEEQKGGLATAITRGFREVEGTYVCVIDADLQHPPRMISALIKEARDSETDIIVGSRYCKGGSYEGLSGPLRKLLSIILKEFVRIVFYPKLNKIKDPLSGFFLIRREVLQNVAFAPIGFKILLEILVRCQWKTVCELPYKFAARTDGKSKATIQQGFTFLRHTMKLFWTVAQEKLLWKLGIRGK
ncbi:MAG: polyprenol monophosphomannose synthase [Candidatus Heimdallarchaeaceae archaeon]